MCPHWAFWNYYTYTSYYEKSARQNIAMLTDAIIFTSQFLVAWMQAASQAPQSP